MTTAWKGEAMRLGLQLGYWGAQPPDTAVARRYIPLGRAAAPCGGHPPGVGPTGDVRLGKRGFELTRAHRQNVLNRALGRLGHGDQRGALISEGVTDGP